MYKRKILVEIGGTIGMVVKLDINTDNKVRGRVAGMDVYVNLERPLVSQILINDKLKKVEYEFLSTVCFRCGRYEHVKEACEHRTYISSIEKKTPLPETLPSGTLLSNTLPEDTRMVVEGIEGK